MWSLCVGICGELCGSARVCGRCRHVCGVCVGGVGMLRGVWSRCVWRNVVCRCMLGWYVWCFAAV